MLNPLKPCTTPVHNSLSAVPSVPTLILLTKQQQKTQQILSQLRPQSSLANVSLQPVQHPVTPPPQTQAEQLQNWVQLSMEELLKIAETTAQHTQQFEQTLYERLIETYSIYYVWMQCEAKHVFFDVVREHLRENDIATRKDTDEAHLLTKAFLVGDNASKSSKYAKHMRTAIHSGITPDDYAAWMRLNTIELVSRREAVLKQPLTGESKGTFARTQTLMHKWLSARMQAPVASFVTASDSYSFDTDVEAMYEITLTKRTRNATATGEDRLDILCTLPRSKELEAMLFNKLTWAFMRNVEMLEAIAETGDEAAFFEEVDVTNAYNEHVTLAHEKHMGAIDAVLATGDEDALAKHCTTHEFATNKLTLDKVRTKRATQAKRLQAESCKV